MSGLLVSAIRKDAEVRELGFRISDVECFILEESVQKLTVYLRSGREVVVQGEAVGMIHLRLASAIGADIGSPVSIERGEIVVVR